MRSPTFIAIAAAGSLFWAAVSPAWAAREAPRPIPLRNILFQYQNANARQVALVGDFNNWQMEPMERDPRGVWKLAKRLPEAVIYRYAFVVDRQLIPDPWNRKTTRHKAVVISVLELHPVQQQATKPPPPPPETEQEITEPTAPPQPEATQQVHLPTNISLRTSYSEESTPFFRWTDILRIEHYLSSDLRIRGEALTTHFRDETGELNRLSGGLAVRQAIGWGLYGDAKFRQHSIDQTSANTEWQAFIGGHPAHSSFETHVGYRQMPVVDNPTLFEDIAFMEGAGSGGSTLASIEDRLSVHEAFGGVAWTPENYYLYGEGLGGNVSDGNHRRLLAFGGGWNALGRFAVRPAQTLYVSADYSDTAYQERAFDYYSPDRLQTYSGGLAWRLTLENGFVLGLEGGRSVSAHNLPGNWATVLTRMPILSWLGLEARAAISDDTVFRTRSLLIGLNGTF